MNERAGRSAHLLARWQLAELAVDGDRHENHAGGVGGRTTHVDRRARRARGSDASVGFGERAALRGRDAAGRYQAGRALAVAGPATHALGRPGSADPGGRPPVCAAALSPCRSQAAAATARAPAPLRLACCKRPRQPAAPAARSIAARCHMRDRRSRSHRDASATGSSASGMGRSARRHGTRPGDGALERRLAAPPATLGEAQASSPVSHALELCSRSFRGFAEHARLLRLRHQARLHCMQL